MTVLTEPHTGEIPRLDLGDRTQLLRVPADLAPPAVDRGEATTLLTQPARNALLHAPSTLLPAADPDAPTRFLESPLLPPTGAELAVALVPNGDDFTTAPTAPPQPLPTPPPAPKPADDQDAAQIVGYAGRHRAFDAEPDFVHPLPAQPTPVIVVDEPGRLWLNLVPRVIDWLFARNLRGAR